MSLETVVHVGMGVCLFCSVALLGYAAFWTVVNDHKRRQASRRLAARGGYLFDRERDDRLSL